MTAAAAQLQARIRPRPASTSCLPFCFWLFTTEHLAFCFFFVQVTAAFHCSSPSSVYKSSHPLRTVCLFPLLLLLLFSSTDVSAIALCGSGKCEGLSWSLSSSPPSAVSSPPPAGSSGKPQQCEAPEGDDRHFNSSWAEEHAVMMRKYSHRLSLCGRGSWNLGISPLFPAPVTSEQTQCNRGDDT